MLRAKREKRSAEKKGRSWKCVWLTNGRAKSRRVGGRGGIVKVQGMHGLSTGKQGREQ